MALPPRRILTLDGGGVRGLSCLMMIREIMNQIAEDEGIEKPEEMRPADYFDLIGGTSTGGLIAILLGRLRLTTKEAILLYRQLAKEIFQEQRGWSVGGLRLSKGGQERYDAKILESAIKKVVKDFLKDPEATMYQEPKDGERHCRTFVLAVYSDSVNNPEPHLFTTYNRHDGTKIWEAARATSAATGFFGPMMIGDPPVRYVDAGLGYNNPGEQAYDEAKRLWCEVPIGVFLSLGTGKETEASLPDSGRLFGLSAQAAQIKVLIDLTTTAAGVHNKLFKRFKREKDTQYFRFNVDQGLHKIGLDEWNQESKLAGFTSAYFDNAETLDLKERCATRLRQLTGAAKPFTIPADVFTAGHENDIDNPGEGSPRMKFWYREKVGESGYPDDVVVDTKFQKSDIRPPGNTILSCRRIVHIQLRGQAFNIPHGRYRVNWIILPPPNHDCLFYFPFGLKLSVGRAQNQGHRFMHDVVDADKNPLLAPRLLEPGFQEWNLSPGLWNTYKNTGWCEIGGLYVDVDVDGHMAFVISKEFERQWYGGFSFGGVRLEPIQW
ncbi:hypothetical protein COCVIDRAFT_115882 [Bipolaris victoriae FI3]|uniref:PNPLA domain-containing protein n=1 Tax=Bipolaris victoriae (strain FI3) TaxID=930091 RepID=W7DR18_BIPV3|nr:hypothetical protein COCVIDRAFT_115882 [Bipolaris victoriae FI3]